MPVLDPWTSLRHRLLVSKWAFGTHLASQAVPEPDYLRTRHFWLFCWEVDFCSKSTTLLIYSKKKWKLKNRGLIFFDFHPKIATRQKTSNFTLYPSSMNRSSVFVQVTGNPVFRFLTLHLSISTIIITKVLELLMKINPTLFYFPLKLDRKDSSSSFEKRVLKNAYFFKFEWVFNRRKEATGYEDVLLGSLWCCSFFGGTMARFLFQSGEKKKVKS